jgi:hypothetical protein
LALISSIALIAQASVIGVAAVDT